MISHDELESDQSSLNMTCSTLIEDVVFNKLCLLNSDRLQRGRGLSWLRASVSAMQLSRNVTRHRGDGKRLKTEEKNNCFGDRWEENDADLVVNAVTKGAFSCRYHDKPDITSVSLVFVFYVTVDGTAANTTVDVVSW